MKTVVIVGSSRKDGDTKQKVNRLVQNTTWDIVDLNNYNISYYDYSHSNKTDDYIDLMRHIINTYDVFVFATPVYWYSMSGIMKVFFDRITDLLTIEKAVGRQLRKKKMAVLSCSGGGNLGDAFWLPFSESANYLGMEYLGNLHTYAGKDDDIEIDGFVKALEEKI